MKNLFLYFALIFSVAASAQTITIKRGTGGSTGGTTTDASLLSSGTIPSGRYGASTIPMASLNASGTPSASTVLVGNGSWTPFIPYAFTSPTNGQYLMYQGGQIVNTAAPQSGVLTQESAPDNVNMYFKPSDTSLNVRYLSTWYKFKQNGGGATTPTTNFDANAQAYFDRVELAGGTISLSDKNAYNTLVTSLKSANLYSSIPLLNPLLGGTAASMGLNAISSSHSTSWTGSPTFSVNAVTFNGSTNYGTVAFNAATNITSINSATLGYFHKSTAVTNGGWAIGSGQPPETPGSFHINPQYEGVAYADIGETAAQINAGNATPRGLYIITRTAANSVALYKNSTSIGTNTTTITGTLPNHNITVGAHNFAAPFGAMAHMNGEVALFFVANAGWNQTQVTAFNNAIQTFITATGK